MASLLRRRDTVMVETLVRAFRSRCPPVPSMDGSRPPVAVRVSAERPIVGSMPSGGTRRAVTGPRVEVRRSARRKRTVQAYRQGDAIVVLLPQGMSATDEERYVESLVERVLAH